jgi:hypothetical protein
MSAKTHSKCATNGKTIKKTTFQITVHIAENINTATCKLWENKQEDKISDKNVYPGILQHCCLRIASTSSSG